MEASLTGTREIFGTPVLHEPGAGPRGRHRRAQRPVQPGRHVLRDADRPQTLHRRDRHGSDLQAQARRICRRLRRNSPTTNDAACACSPRPPPTAISRPASCWRRFRRLKCRHEAAPRHPCAPVAARRRRPRLGCPGVRDAGRAADRSRELREEGGIDRARADVRVRGRSRARPTRCRGWRARNCATMNRWRSSSARWSRAAAAGAGALCERLRRLVAKSRAAARSRSDDLRRVHRGALLRALRGIGGPAIGAPLGDFFQGLHAAEARHFMVYLDLARRAAKRAGIDAEGRDRGICPPRGGADHGPDAVFRFHSGPPAGAI